jgi:hypothetical protein
MSDEIRSRSYDYEYEEDPKPMTDDRGAAALAERILDQTATYGLPENWYGVWRRAWPEGLAAAILGEHGVFLPDGLTDGALNEYDLNVVAPLEAELERLRGALGVLLARGENRIYPIDSELCAARAALSLNAEWSDYDASRVPAVEYE